MSKYRYRPVNGLLAVNILDRALKQRLLGAVMLAALLVIFVPELLDGAGHKARFTKQLQIPAEPVFLPMPALAEPASIIQAKPLKALEVPVVQDSSVTEKTNKKKSHKPRLNAWVLQVGSFNDKANAILFRDKLRSQSYDAFIDVKKQTHKKVWRVRVGPELIKTRLEKVKARILKQHQIKAMIIKHK